MVCLRDGERRKAELEDGQTRAGGEGLWFDVVCGALCRVRRVVICGDVSLRAPRDENDTSGVVTRAFSSVCVDIHSSLMNLSTGFGIESSTFTRSRMDLCSDTSEQRGEARTGAHAPAVRAVSIFDGRFRCAARASKVI
jgi:hypothetical protein